MTTKTTRRWGARVAAGAIVLGGTLALTACDATDRLLQVDNPEEIPEDQLDNPLLVGVLVNGVIGDFQAGFDDPFIWRGSMLSDEQVTGINWEDDARINQRLILFDEDPADIMFSSLSLARQQADSVSGRLRTLLEDPDNDPRLATTLAYAGYGFTFLADAMCESTINVSNETFTADEMYQFAVTRFDEALDIATRVGSTDLANLARVGLSRAHLNLGNDNDAMTFASQVPDDFRYWSEYSANSTGENNILFARTSGSNHSLGMSPFFLQGDFGEQGLVGTQTDPRIQHTPDWSLGHNRLTLLYKPRQPWSYSGYTGGTIAAGDDPPGFDRDTDVTFASGLEARHNFYEAMGPSAETLVFVNERRAVGNQAAVNLSGDALMAELREQRGRDLFLGGHRLGDLRRWLRNGTGDLFPSGQHVNAQWGAYGSATCFPLPLEEFEGNPLLPKSGG